MGNIMLYSEYVRHTSKLSEYTDKANNIKEKTTKANALLQAAQDDFINLYGDGDRSKVTKNPVFSVVDAQVQVEILDKLIKDVERVLSDGK